MDGLQFISKFEIGCGGGGGGAVEVQSHIFSITWFADGPLLERYFQEVYCSNLDP